MYATIRRGSRGDDVRRLQKMLNLYQDGIFGQLTEAAVREFQIKMCLSSVDGVVGPATWSHLIASQLSPGKGRSISEIIVHCTATPEGKDFTVDDVRRWHKQQGWSDIGYHYIIYRDGTIHGGRDVSVVGAHCSGHNLHSIGVCYVGGLAPDGHTPKDTRTPEQKDALKSLIRALQTEYPYAGVFGHHDFDPRKDCLCFDARGEYARKM